MMFFYMRKEFTFGLMSSSPTPLLAKPSVHKVTELYTNEYNELRKKMEKSKLKKNTNTNTNLPFAPRLANVTATRNAGPNAVAPFEYT